MYYQPCVINLGMQNLGNVVQGKHI